MSDILPSLAALRAFDLAARHGSLSAAAAELNVTHAAISQHIRTLERDLGQRLTRKDGRGIALTEAGTHLSIALGEGFEAIHRGVADLRRRAEGGPLRISLTPSFAEHWLMPRMGRFWASHPGVDLALVPSTTLVDLRRDGFDLAIRYGQGQWPGLLAERLTSADLVVVGAPSLVRGPLTLDQMMTMPWLINDSDSEQNRWARDVGLDLSQVQATHFPTFGMMHAAVRSGLGLAMLTRAVAEGEIAQGSLRPVFEGRSDHQAYYMVTQKGQVLRRLTPLMRWLRQEAASDAGSTSSTGAAG